VYLDSALFTDEGRVAMTDTYPFPDLDALLTREVGAKHLRDYGYTLASQMLADGKAGPRFTARDGEMRFEWRDLLHWATDDPVVVFWREAIEAARRMGWDEPPPEDDDAIHAAIMAAYGGTGGITPAGVSWMWGDDQLDASAHADTEVPA
jgi:hypothetical protein